MKHLALFLLVACRGGAPAAKDAAVVASAPAPLDAAPAPPPAPLDAAPAPPPPDAATAPPVVHGNTIGAGMFVAGNRWRYQIHDVDDQGKHVSSIVTCTVASVTDIPHGHRSVITCDGEMPGLVAGAWATDKHGLYMLRDPDDKLDRLDIVIPFPPKASKHEEQVNEGFMGDEIVRDGDRWCAKESANSQGDDDDWVTCYDADGIATYQDHDSIEGDTGIEEIDRDFARLPR